MSSKLGVLFAGLTDMKRAVLPFLLAGCSVAPVQSTTTGITTVDHTTADPPLPTTSTTTDAWSTSTGDPTTGEPATTTTTSTTGTLPDFGEGEGCNKIDVVYVLSPEIPKQHRATVREGLLHFNSRLVETFTPNIDLHIMVTDEMIEWSGEKCESECENFGHCNSSGNPDFSCEAMFDAHPCEKVRGAAHMFPIGPGSANQMCGETKHVRFLDTESAELLKKLDCATSTRPFEGLLADHPTDAMVKAVTGDGPDDCNEGFLRDDAILFIVYVAHRAEAWDWEFTPSPEETAEALFSAKGGDKNKVGIVALISDHSLSPNNICEPGYEPLHKNKINSLVQDYLPHHVWGSICAPDMRPVFDDAIELMLEMCVSYTPQ